MNFERTERFKKDYQKLPQHIQKQTDQKLGFLLQDRRHPSLRVKKIKGEPDIFEASITMNYRIKFRITGDTCLLLRIGTHKEILGK